jgi:hypothetical protein
MATQTLTLLFIDIEDSTAMVQRLGDAWAGVLADHHRPARKSSPWAMGFSRCLPRRGYVWTR